MYIKCETYLFCLLNAKSLNMQILNPNIKLISSNNHLNQRINASDYLTLKTKRSNQILLFQLTFSNQELKREFT